MKRYINFPHKEYPGEKFLQVRWNHAGWWDDIISSREFPEECVRRSSVHQEVHRRLKDEKCDCCFCISVTGNKAELDYINLSKRQLDKNGHNDILLGILTITFTDNTRSAVKEISWEDDKGKQERKCGVTSWDVVPLNDFKMPKKSKEKYVEVTRKERINQSRFKASLLDVYGQRCSVSGCPTKEVLEAAHIIPAGDENSYDIRNGLLLRADLHILFDAGFLRINPKTLQILLAQSVRKDSTYKKFHRNFLRKPLHGCPGPDRMVLAKKWRMSHAR